MVICMQATLQAATKTANTHDIAGLKQRRPEVTMRKRPRCDSVLDRCSVLINSALQNSHRCMLAADANEDNDSAKCGGRARWMRRRIDRRRLEVG